MNTGFKVGQKVKYMPAFRTEGELFEIAEHSGLSPRKLYTVAKIESQNIYVEGGGFSHVSSFVNGELDFKLGNDDNSWQEQRLKIIKSHENFNKKHT